MRRHGTEVAAAVRIAARIALPAAALLLAGCFATTKHVEMVQADVTRRSAWEDEKIQELNQQIGELKAENDALKSRVDDLTDEQSTLSKEVSGRLSELQAADQRTSEEARHAAERAAALGQNREQDRTDLLQRMNAILDEVVKENKDLRARIDAIEASSASGGGGGHTVQPGETLASIASKYGTTAQAIVSANGLPDANHIQVGQRLVIPGR